MARKLEYPCAGAPNHWVRCARANAEDEALAVAISLDASTTLVARATEGSTAEGWQPLLAEVRALLE